MNPCLVAAVRCMSFTRENHRDTLSDALLGAYADLFAALVPVIGAPAK
jgi:hypothetical protein